MKTALYKGSIEKKFIFDISLLISVLFVIAYIVFVAWYLKEQTTKDLELSKTITRGLSQDMAKLIFLNDLNIASDVTSRLQSFTNLDRLVLFDKNKKSIYQYAKDKKNFKIRNLPKNLAYTKKGNLLYVYTKASYKGMSVGYIAFDMNIITIKDILKKDMLFLVTFFFIILLTSYLLARFYAKQFTKPILKLVSFLELVEFENLTTLKKRIKITYDNEFGKLYEEINIIFDKMQYYINKKDIAEEKLEYLVQFDSLTGLANKQSLLQHLKENLNNTKIWNAMFHIKIKDLKTINNIYGHKYGDLIIQEFAKRLLYEFKDSVFQAKIGVSEFILEYQDLDYMQDVVISKSKTIAETLLAVFSKPFKIGDKSIKIDINIGINLYQKKQTDENELLKDVNIALETSRKNNTKIEFFNQNIKLETKSNFDIYENLTVAIQEEQFELYYQLQYANDGVYGAEALIRWNHPKKGLVPPMKFIPVAEKTDQIIEIGNWVLNAGCKQLAKWSNDAKTKEWILAINVSAKQFKQKDFIKQVKKAVQSNGVNYKNLKIELLESLFVDNVKDVVQKMEELHKLGVQLSLDDFGTGYSSLQYLKDFPINQIKIDQSFVRNMFNNDKDIKIIKSIIYLGKLLDMDVIAEGVETKEHYEKLQELNCLYYQGYYFAKPQRIDLIEF